MSVKREHRKFVFINEEQLIHAVESHEILYDRTLKGYKKPAERESAWQDIANTINFPVDECKKRWRSLRDAFMKQHRSISNEGSKKKTWLYFNQMQFLLPHINQNSLKSDVYDHDQSDISTITPKREMVISAKLEEYNESDDNENDQDNETSNTNKFEDAENDPLHDNFYDESEIINLPIIQNKSNTSLEMQIKNEAAQRVRADVEIISHTDSNEKFLLSCAPILKRLSNRKNSLARLKIQKLLYDVEFDDDEI